jgi:acetyl esterase
MTEPYSDADGLVRVYPAREPDGTGLVWAHGGGFVHGDLDMPEADWVARQVASRGTTVVSVEYRLASGAVNRYPAASDDVLTAWSWALASADRLRIDRSRLAVGGASAGGNLAAGAVLRMLERGDDALPALVLLAYPTLLAVQPAPDAALRAALDADPAADRFGPAVVREMYETYLGGPVDGAPIGAVPGLATADDLSGFPPTLIVNGDRDELRVSGEAFAASLVAAGRDVEVVTETGTDHGFLNRPREGFAASVTVARLAARLASLFGTTPQSLSAPAAAHDPQNLTADPEVPALRSHKSPAAHA